MAEEGRENLEWLAGCRFLPVSIWIGKQGLFTCLCLSAPADSPWRRGWSANIAFGLWITTRAPIRTWEHAVDARLYTFRPSQTPHGGGGGLSMNVIAGGLWIINKVETHLSLFRPSQLPMAERTCD
jgi:hypothetical protein